MAIAEGAVDPVTGAVTLAFEDFVIADCSSPHVDDCDYWQWIQGTSMASPHAVGVAALIVSEYGKAQRHGKGRTMDPAKVERILRKSATDHACTPPAVTYELERPGDPTYDAPCVGDEDLNSIYGDGIVNALRAVKGKH